MFTNIANYRNYHLFDKMTRDKKEKLIQSVHNNIINKKATFD